MAKHLYAVIYDAAHDGHLGLDEGEFVDGINNDVSTIVSTISYGIDTACNILYSVGTVCVLSTVDFRLTLLILLLPCLSMLLSVCLRKRVVALTSLTKESEDAFSRTLIGLLANGRKLRIEGEEEEATGWVASVLATQRKRGAFQVSFTDELRGLTATLSELSLVLIVAYAVHVPNILENGGIVLFVGYSFDIAGTAQYVNSLILALHQCISYLGDFNEKYRLGSSSSSRKACEPSARELAEHIEWGRVNVLVGANGPGKTSALLGFSDYLDHDGHTDDRIDCASRGHVGRAVLLRRPIHLLNVSVRENVCLDTTCPRDAFNSIVRGVSLPPTEFPDGYDTVVAPRSTNISDGQAFRIALARTVCAAMACEEEGDDGARGRGRHGTCCLLIDDNFLSVDERARQHILQYLKEMRQTVVLADHEVRDMYRGCNLIRLD